MPKRLIEVVLFLYLLLLIRLIIFKYPSEYLLSIMREWSEEVVREGIRTANFTPGKSIRMYLKYFPQLNGFENLFGNILALVPLGYLLPQVVPRRRGLWVTGWISLAIILGMELFQLFSGFGAFDIDDILLNMCGVLVGYVIFSLLYNKK